MASEPRIWYFHGQDSRLASEFVGKPLGRPRGQHGDGNIGGQFSPGSRCCGLICRWIEQRSGQTVSVNEEGFSDGGCPRHRYAFPIRMMPMIKP
jgi:hypothetical protein